MVAPHVFRLSWTLAYKPMRSTRHIIVLKTNRLGHVLFPFARWQHCWYANAFDMCIRRTWLLLTIDGLLLHCWYSLGRPVTIGTPMVIFAVLTVFWLFLVHCWYKVGTVLVDLWRLVHQWFWVFLTIGTVYHSSKTVKRSQNSKNDHWCINRHMSTSQPFWLLLQ